LVRVAIDARLLAYQQAGTASYIRGILTGLGRLADAPEVTVVASRRRPDDESFSEIGRFLSVTPCHHRYERWSLGLELATLAVDVVHSPDFIPPRRFGRHWARVITVHDLAFLKQPELVTPESRAYYGQVFTATRVADRIIAVSRATRDDLLDLVSESLESKIAVIPEGVNSCFQPIERTAAREQVRDRFGVERPYILFVGTIEPRKNLPTLLEAFRKLQASMGTGSVELVLAGARGWLADEVEDLARSFGGSVRLVGRVTTPELVALYNAALVLTLVSLDEGFGLPAIEAMACGTPVLATRVGALPEIVGDTGLLVDPRDVDAIHEQLRCLVGDSNLRQSLANRGRLRAAGYQWRAVAERTLRIYSEAAACAS
jgi:glycosyltransferase involved in cell wall biosynthesis